MLAYILEWLPKRVKLPSFKHDLYLRPAFYESCSLELEWKWGGEFHLKLNTDLRPIVHKYRKGKMKRTLERLLNVPEITVAKASASTCAVGDCIVLALLIVWNMRQLTMRFTRFISIWLSHDVSGLLQPRRRVYGLLAIYCDCSQNVRMCSRLDEMLPLDPSWNTDQGV